LTELEESLVCIAIVRKLTSIEPVKSNERLTLNMQVLELMEARHSPPERSMFQLTQVEAAVLRNCANCRLGFLSYLNALIGVLNTTEFEGESWWQLGLPPVALRAGRT
jgi:hypothetical protein